MKQRGAVNRQVTSKTTDMSGRLEELFEIELQGLELPTAAEFHPRRDLKAKLSPGSPAQLSVSVVGTDESTTHAVSARFVRKLYLKLLLRFARNIEHAAHPRRIRSSFSSEEAESSGSTATVSASLSGHTVVSASATVVISRAELDTLINDLETSMRTPEPVTSAELYTAIDMYATSLESRNKVVRFLVLYSALALAALFKWHTGNQEKVDELLLAVNSTLPVLPSQRYPKRNETLYTKLRNDLIHAEERGRDPAHAMAAIETRIVEFQHDVAQVLCGL
jgi:hypothetical protein